MSKWEQAQRAALELMIKSNSGRYIECLYFVLENTSVIEWLNAGDDDQKALWSFLESWQEYRGKMREAGLTISR